MKKQTYVLFVPGTAGPTVYHEGLEAARAEAKRLVAEVGVSKVMICEFIEGIESVKQVRKLRGNPLKQREEAMRLSVSDIPLPPYSASY